VKNSILDADRRIFIKNAGVFVAGTLLACSDTKIALAKAPGEKNKKDKEDVSPPEDLMREHGVLRRILLIYENERSKLTNEKSVSGEVLSTATGIIHNFIEMYHEKLEEDYLFPRFHKAGKLIELVTVLKQQHQAGRRLTEHIRRLAEPGNFNDTSKRKELAAMLDMFTSRYRPHAAREDTVLFPALRTVVSGKEFDELGERFEEKEIELFGEGGFEKIVSKVAEIEKGLGIYELSHFTPHVG